LGRIFRFKTVPRNILVKGWDRFPYCSETVNYGTSFLRKKEYLALKVPTLIIPDEFNFILNPLHPDIQAFRKSRNDNNPDKEVERFEVIHADLLNHKHDDLNPVQANQ